MTTDPEEGRRQIEAMKPEPLKVGDKVRLKSGSLPMTVIELYDYGREVEVEWKQRPISDLVTTERERFPIRSLVRIEAEK